VRADLYLPLRLVFNRLDRKNEIPDTEGKILEDTALEIRNRAYELYMPAMRRKLNPSSCTALAEL
jgi:hypothetical protein